MAKSEDEKETVPVKSPAEKPLTDNEQIVTTVEGTENVAQTETVVVFKVNRLLMDHEYDELEKRVRQENEKSGMKIVIAPYSVDVEITGG